MYKIIKCFCSPNSLKIAYMMKKKSFEIIKNIILQKYINIFFFPFVGSSNVKWT